MNYLTQIKDNFGARHARKRLGRGIGSGLGKTAGRGHKGQKARSGVRLKGYEGGQTPIYIRLPKRGFKPLERKSLVVAKLVYLQQAFDKGLVKSGDKLSERKIAALSGAKFSHSSFSSKNGVKLLSDGRENFNVPLVVTVTSISQAAREAIEKAGGQVTLISELSLEELLQQDKGADLIQPSTRRSGTKKRAGNNKGGGNGLERANLESHAMVESQTDQTDVVGVVQKKKRSTARSGRGDQSERGRASPAAQKTEAKRGKAQAKPRVSKGSQS